jgi:hypothetical protein
MIRQVTVRTPQHRNGQVFDYTVQIGEIDTKTWEFWPIKHLSGSVGSHRVSFKDQDTFLKFEVK